MIGELPLVIIPYIQTDEDISKNKLRIKMALAFLFVLAAAGLLLVHFFFLKLDVLWYTLLRKIGEL